MRPHYSQPSRENATLSSGTSPLASLKEVPPPPPPPLLEITILCFHYHTIKNKNATEPCSQYRESRIWEMKEVKYTKSLAKNQVCPIIRMRDIRKNVFPKFKRLCMETPCWCRIEGRKYGRWNLINTNFLKISKA